MKLQFEDRNTQGHFSLLVDEPAIQGEGILNGKRQFLNTIVCNPGTEQTVKIDEIDYLMPAASVLPLVANQTFRFERPHELISWQFNREFYCIADHDSEVGCVGFLFYGIRHPLFILLSQPETESIRSIQQLCVEDMQVRDKMQGEMLRTLLKRLIIKVTRLAKKQTEQYQCFSEEKMDLVRQFNLLVETHFRTQHEVRFYAHAMCKSPKTLSNLFGACHYPPPSKLIQNRIIQEVKRYLFYTDKSAKQIADELGFVSTAHFSRFFKMNTGTNFSAFKASARDEELGRMHRGRV